MIIVEIEKDVWLSGGDGDQGRTLVIGNAKIFNSIKSAKAAITRARKYKPFANAMIKDLAII